MNISIHALREEGDEDALDFLFEVLGFLSTPSARRATGGVPAKAYFRVESISIHALREEGDSFTFCSQNRTAEFLSTPSARRATTTRQTTVKDGKISIHALREEGDTYLRPLATASKKISIHALREEGDSKNRDKISIFL